MRKILRPLTFYMMRKLYRLFVDWRRLFFLGAFITTFGVVFQSLIIPYPLHTWFRSSPIVVVASYNSLNNTTTHLTETRTLAKVEEFPLVAITPVVLLNSSDALPIVEKKGKVRRRTVTRRRRKNSKIDERNGIKSTPSPPMIKAAPSPLQRYVWSLPPDKALTYAKREMELAQIVVDDPDLYAPLFRNITIFKRSYELMELILKVYIYPDGKSPIFHQPHLQGIYASEGWFMKLMEENRQFVTKDPEKAHLFYLPYSARQLELALYVPESHNLKPLSIFLKDYVNMLASKYPFWNRSRGTDHFLVACHDWGPYTLTGHKELTKNTIKALCNADKSEGIFVAGKDVSLPETTIRTPKKPLRYIGGNRVSQRPILAFFAGNMHGPVRPALLKHWVDKDDDMRIYGPLPNRVSRKMSYVQHMKSSRYCICPMGYEVNSPRIVEAIYYECVPVIIADNFVPPFNEVLDWNAFAVIVAEKDIPRLKDILLSIPMRRYMKMQINVKMLQRHFLWNPRPIKYDLFHMVLHSIWFSRLNQIKTTDSE